MEYFMGNTIRKVCIIGSGVMGCNIAAHLVNSGVDVLLLDQKKDGDLKNAYIHKNIDMFSSMKPSIFFTKSLKKHIIVGNIEDDLHTICDYDWVIEVIIEKLSIKKQLFKSIDSILSKKGKYPIISSNTSGLSVEKMSNDTTDKFKQHFLVTHFFNPVRYMYLLEIIAHPQTLQNIITNIQRFCSNRLGKGTILCKDSPNFIANRIGTYAILKVLQLMKDKQYGVADIDYIFGPAVGKPRSAIFKTLDIVGLDTFAHVAQNCFDNLKNDSENNIFLLPKVITTLINNKSLGRKSKQGFYKKDKSSLFVWNFQKNMYELVKSKKYDSIEGAKRLDSLADRINFVLTKTDEASVLVKTLTVFVCIYAANRIFEISDNIEDIDNAMKWGFGWEQGPFENADILGIQDLITTAQDLHCKMPTWLTNSHLLERNKFYIYDEGVKKVWDPLNSRYKDIQSIDNNVVNFITTKHTNKNIIAQTDATTIVDIGENILTCEFHTKLNSIDFGVLNDIENAINICETKQCKGLILYNEGKNFSVGMNLGLIYMGIQAKEWKQIDNMCKKYQDLCVRLKYSPIITVAAPFNLTLGGGAELAMWCNKIEAHAELYMGLVESAVGLLPGAGGSIELLHRTCCNVPEDNKISKDIIISKALETVALAKVSTSALEAREYRFLSMQDGVTMNKKNHLQSAKLSVLNMYNSGFCMGNRRTFKLPGLSAYTNFKIMLNNMKESGYISSHDMTVALKIAYLLSGGDCNPTYAVSEQYLLDLEREAFLSLCGEQKTYDRIEHMLIKKKPLRN